MTKAKDTAPVAVGTVTIDRLSDGKISISVRGEMDPTNIAIAIFHLNRIANQMMDAAVMREAQTTDPKGLEIVRAMPDALAHGRVD